MNPLEIEDTSDWLGSPTRLETVQHYASMLEEDVQVLKRDLRAAKHLDNATYRHRNAHGN